QMQAFAQGLRHALLGADAQPAGIYLSSSSSSGALWNIPAQALPATTGFATDTPVNAPGTILLTGATGFIGVHILRELLEQSCATVHCLVRAPSQADAQ
ncbi:SDR family oxidoreductase, partial [Xanthomonas hortorum]